MKPPLYAEEANDAMMLPTGFPHAIASSRLLTPVEKNVIVLARALIQDLGLLEGTKLFAPCRSEALANSVANRLLLSNTQVLTELDTMTRRPFQLIRYDLESDRFYLQPDRGLSWANIICLWSLPAGSQDSLDIMNRLIEEHYPVWKADWLSTYPPDSPWSYVDPLVRVDSEIPIEFASRAEEASRQAEVTKRSLQVARRRKMLR